MNTTGSDRAAEDSFYVLKKKSMRFFFSEGEMSARVWEPHGAEHIRHGRANKRNASSVTLDLWNRLSPRRERERVLT